MRLRDVNLRMASRTREYPFSKDEKIVVRNNRCSSSRRTGDPIDPPWINRVLEFGCFSRRV